MSKKVIPQTSIFNYKSKEFLINLNSKDIPPIHHSDYDSFILHEEEKSIKGVNINGIHIPGSLYFELNHWNIKIDVLDSYGNVVKEINNPKLKDNSWIIHNAYEEAFKQKKILILGGSRQIGKELADYEIVMTNKGEIPICNLKVGDVVYGKDGKETRVIGVYPQGVKPIYRMTLLDGRIIDCGLDHQWEVECNNKILIKTTKELLNSNLKTKHKKSGFNYKYKIPSIKPVEFTKKDLPINPYLLGLLLGDGTTCHQTPSISTCDQQIEDNIKNILGEDYKITYDKEEYNRKNYNCRRYITYIGKDKYTLDKKGCNPLYRSLIKLDLHDKNSYTKFIPDIYKYSSIQDRIDILSGIIDSDGWVSTSGNIEIKLVNEKLAKDILYIARSLGIRGEIVTKMTEWKSNNQKGSSLVSRVYLRTDLPISKLDRKLNRILKKRKRTNAVSIDKIEYLKDYSATCISVDNKDKIFLTKDFIPTHNTVTLTSLLGRQMTLFPNTFSLGLYANSKDQEVNAGYLETGLENLKYLKIPRLDKDWKKGLIRLGYKQVDNTDEIWSTLYMRNTDEGKNTEVGAGTTLNFFVFDEIAKAPVSKAMEAVKPALISEFGLRCSPIYAFTGGDVIKSKDAENLYLNPKANDVLEFDNEGKKTGLFLGGWYRQDFKSNKTLTEYLKLKTSSELDSINIQVTDFDLANQILDKEQLLLASDPDKSKLIKHKMYYPRTIQEMFLTENENPFPRELLLQQLEFLRSNNIGQNIELFRSIDDNKVKWKFSDKFPINEYPTKSFSLDAPIIMYDSPEKFKGQKGLHKIGVDSYSDSEAPNSDSLGSVYVMRVNHSDLSDPFNGSIVASYTARPKTMKEFNDVILMLCEFYDAEIMYEHVHDGFLQYFDSKNKAHLLINTPSLQKEINPKSNVGNVKGLRATVGNKKHALNLVLDYLNEELPDGKLGVTRILDPVLIEEMLAYDGVKNTDRYIAFSMAIEAFYMYKKYTTIVNYEEEDKKLERKKDIKIFGVSINNRTNPFGLKIY